VIKISNVGPNIKYILKRKRGRRLQSRRHTKSAPYKVGAIQSRRLQSRRLQSRRLQSRRLQSRRHTKSAPNKVGAIEKTLNTRIE